MIEKIKNFLHETTFKKGFNSVVFGLSGGIDSAVVAYFCKEVFGFNARAFIIPSSSSNPSHLEDALNYAKYINLSYEVVNISNIQFAFKNTLNLDSIHRIGNLCSRIRMCILYDMSFKYNSLVVGCSNKSELMLGYGTHYGDLAYALNPIGDIFKTDIFSLAKEIGIPKYIINKPPSADLFENQNDESDLGYSYERIDEVLKKIDLGFKYRDLENHYEEEFLKSIFNRVEKNAFKSQLPLILKCKEKIN